jgi:hypothetical protein
LDDDGLKSCCLNIEIALKNGEVYDIDCKIFVYGVANIARNVAK